VSPCASRLPKWRSRVELGVDLGQSVDFTAIAVVERRVEHRPDFRRSSKLVAGPVTNQLKGKSHPWAVPVRTNRRSSSQNSWVAVNSGTCPYPSKA
jgi:hypothetical protein